MRNIFGLLGRQNTAAPSWDPSRVAAKTVFWLRADSGVTSSSWTDKTNGNVFAVQLTDTITSDNSGINGQARLVFSGSHGLKSTIARIVTATQGQLILIGKNATGDGGGIYQGLGANDAEFLPRTASGGILEIFGTNTRKTGSTLAPTAGQSFAYQVSADNAGNWVQRLNGSTLQTLTGNTFSMLGEGGGGMVEIAGSGFFGFTYSGEFEEMIVLDTPLTLGEQTSMAGYILSRYGMTL